LELCKVAQNKSPYAGWPQSVNGMCQILSRIEPLLISDGIFACGRNKGGSKGRIWTVKLI
jgi:hypothetical protein